MRPRNRIAQRALRALAVLATAAALGACDNMLDVTNPAAVDPSNLQDPTMTGALTNSVVGEFQRMYTQNAYWGAILSDEAVTGHNYTQYHDFDLRIVDEGNFTLPDVYNPVQRARALGEDIVSNLRTTLGDTAKLSISFATALAYTGMANQVLAESFCSAPVDPKAQALSPEEISARAITFFDEAIAVAAAAKAAHSTVAAAADNIANLARVGAARAALLRADKAKAIQYASAVPAAWTLYIVHSSDDAKTYLNNPFYAAVTGSSKNLGVDTYFRGLNDPRVKHTRASMLGHDQRTPLYVPAMPESFGSWAPTDSLNFAIDSRVRLASGLEARYILAEAGGMDAATLTAFLNERRTVGKQGAYAGTDPMGELRDQRRRDFFLDGHRLGDIRRYKKQYGIDFFPTGAYVNPAYGTTYGTAECFIPTRNEWIGYPRN